MSERLPDSDDLWFAPAFWDIQTNGRRGLSFADPTLHADQVAQIIRDHARLGTARLCPTLITGPREAFLRSLVTLGEACEADTGIEGMVAGIHLEGPYISGLDGYRGAHPIESVRDPDWDEFRRFQEASGGRVKLVTLAPERAGALGFIEKVVTSGVVVAIGHTAADGDMLRAAARAGATLSTHLGNGIAANLARHPNPIFEQAALDSMSASFIADGHHLDDPTLRVLARAKSPDRTILVSDASPLAGLPVGEYGPWAVDPSGKVVVSGTLYLAGSNRGLDVGLNTLGRATGWSLAERFATVTANPSRLLSKKAPILAPGEPANLVLFRVDATGMIELVETCVDGWWVAANETRS